MQVILSLASQTAFSSIYKSGLAVETIYGYSNKSVSL